MSWQRHQVSAAVVFLIAAGISMIVTDCLILLTFTSYTATAIRVIQFGFLLSAARNLAILMCSDSITTS